MEQFKQPIQFTFSHVLSKDKLLLQSLKVGLSHTNIFKAQAN